MRILSLIFSFYFRKFKWAKNIQERFKAKLSLKLKSKVDFSYIKINGPFSVKLRDLKIEDRGNRFCLKADTVVIKLNISSIVSGVISFNALSILNSTIVFDIQKRSTDILSPPEIPDTNKLNSEGGLRKALSFSYKVLDLLPKKINLINARIKLKYKSRTMLSTNFSMKVTDDKRKSAIKSPIVAILDKKARTLDFFASYNGEEAADSDSFSTRHNQLNAASASLKVGIDWSDGKCINTAVHAEANHVNVQSKMIADSQISFNKVKGIFGIKVSRDEISLGNQSRFSADRLNFSPELLYKHVYPRFVTCVLTGDPVEISELKLLLPFFKTPLTTMEISGSYSPRVFFTVAIDPDMKKQFDVRLLADDFLIKDFGHFDINYLKYPFIHVVEEEGEFIRRIHLAESSASFCSLNNIPTLLSETIVYTEDPNFYKHKGIDEEQLGEALVYNLRSGLFSKGASTISMQVARNLFLGHRKNIGRKFEEIVIAYLMENVFFISKKRILEIYLNIIEFSDTAYGLSEACRLYFKKEIDSITLEEGLIISYIIPRPKFFIDAVRMDSSKLKHKLSQHVKFYARVLFRKNLIQEQTCRDVLMNFNIDEWLKILRENLEKAPN